MVIPKYFKVLDNYPSFYINVGIIMQVYSLLSVIINIYFNPYPNLENQTVHSSINEFECLVLETAFIIVVIIIYGIVYLMYKIVKNLVVFKNYTLAKNETFKMTKLWIKTLNILLGIFIMLGIFAFIIYGLYRLIIPAIPFFAMFIVVVRMIENPQNYFSFLPFLILNLICILFNTKKTIKVFLRRIQLLLTAYLDCILLGLALCGVRFLMYPYSDSTAVLFSFLIGFYGIILYNEFKLKRILTGKNKRHKKNQKQMEEEIIKLNKK